VASRPADHLARLNGDDALAYRLGARLRERRLALGRTLADVAGEAEISVSYLSALEKGVNMASLPVLARLVHALRLTLHELLREDEPGQVRTDDIALGQRGAQYLSHPDLRLQVTSLVSHAGESGNAPLEVAALAVFVFVDRGALIVEVDGHPHALGAGDALDAVDVELIRWESLGEATALSIWGASPPRSRSHRPPR